MRAMHRNAAFFAVSLVGLAATSSVQAATLACGVPLRVSTASASDWQTDAKYVSDPTGPVATVRDDFLWYGYFNPATVTHGTGTGSLEGQPLAGKWLGFGQATMQPGSTGTPPYPAVTVAGVTANGAWTAGRVTFIRNETITVAPDVDLSTIRIVGTGGGDNNARFVVKPATLPGDVANTTWFTETNMLGGSWGSPANIDLSGGLGFYYGENTIGFSTSSESTTAVLPTGVVADVEITADCATEPASQPTAILACPAGSQAGDEVRVGPFTTNARDWKWTWRNNAGTLENVEQPLYDSYRYRSYFNPSTLAESTAARWISPGTTDPASTDVPGVPYPQATGQAKAGYHAAVFEMSQSINVGDNVDLASIKLDGRFGFDDYGNTVFVKPVGGSPVFDNSGLYMPNGFTSFATTTTPAIPGFERGQNTIGLMLDGGQNTNDCAAGTCALAAIADFYVTAACTGEPPSADLSITNTGAAASVAPGATVTYTITASNAGPVEATGATVTNTLPAALTDATWTCVGAGGGTCSASGSGNINDTVNLPVGASVTYTVTAKVAANATGSLASTASIAAPAGIDDPTPVNNSATANSAIATPGSATPVPALDLAGLALLGALSAGIGAFALRRRQRGQ